MSKNDNKKKSLDIIAASYHTGIRNHHVGAGTSRILASGLLNRLNNLGYTFTFTGIDAIDDFDGEIDRSFEVIRRIIIHVFDIVKRGSFSIILAGLCNAEVGVAAGMGDSVAAYDLIWFDAHSDLDTPDEATSGYFDAMGESMLTGGAGKRSWLPSLGISIYGWIRSFFAAFAIDLMIRG